MKAAVFRGPRDIRFEEVEKPTLEEGEVLLRVRACGICGSDLHTYRHGMFREVLGLPVETGCILGHGFSAEVAEIRGDVAGVEVGDRVITVATGANAEYIKIVRLFGSWAWTPEELARASRLISSGKIDRKPLISHTFSLEDADKAHETQLQEEEAIKVVLTP